VCCRVQEEAPRRDLYIAAANAEERETHDDVWRCFGTAGRRGDIVYIIAAFERSRETHERTTAAF
jgi:hypothetical protein